MKPKETPAPVLPPVDPAALEETARRIATRTKPPGGWPWQKPKEAKEGDGK